MDLLKIITGLLSTAYKLDNGEITALLESGDDNTEEKVLEILKQKDVDRVAAIKKAGETAGKFQEGYAKAKKEVLTDLEKQVKEKFEIQSDATGLELIEAIVTEKSAAAGAGKKGEITDDDVKKHPVYQNLEKKAKSDLTAKETEWATKLKTIEDSQKKAETFAVVKTKALSVLEGLKPIKSQNAEVATTIQNLFLNSLEGYEYDTTTPDRTLVLKDGKVVEDAHGHSLILEELVKTNATKFFEFEKNNGGSNGGNNNDDKGKGGAGGGYPAGIVKPKTLEELAKITNDDKIPSADRMIVLETYEKEFGK